MDKDLQFLEVFNNIMLCLCSPAAYYKRTPFYLNVVFNLMFDRFVLFFVKCKYIIVIFCNHIITITLIICCVTYKRVGTLCAHDQDSTTSRKNPACIYVKQAYKRSEAATANNCTRGDTSRDTDRYCDPTRNLLNHQTDDSNKSMTGEKTALSMCDGEVRRTLTCSKAGVREAVWRDGLHRLKGLRSELVTTSVGINSRPLGFLDFPLRLRSEYLDISDTRTVSLETEVCWSW